MTVLKELLKLNEAVKAAKPNTFVILTFDIDYESDSGRDINKSILAVIDAKTEDDALRIANMVKEKIQKDEAGVWDMAEDFVGGQVSSAGITGVEVAAKRPTKKHEMISEKDLVDELKYVNESTTSYISEAVGKSAKEKLKKVLDTLLSSFTSGELDEILVDSGYGPSTRATIEKSKFVKLSPNKVAMYAVLYRDDGSFNNEEERQGKIYVELKNGKLVGEF